MLKFQEFYGGKKMEMTAIEKRFLEGCIALGDLWSEEIKFEPYYTIHFSTRKDFENRDDQEARFAQRWLLNEFCYSELSHFDQRYGLPNGSQCGWTDGEERFNYGICWIPSYSVARSYHGEGARIYSYIDFDCDMRTFWKPSLISVPAEEQYGNAVSVWNKVAGCWVENPRIQMSGQMQWEYPIRGKRLTADEFKELCDILKKFERKNIFPSWWDWNYG